MQNKLLVRPDKGLTGHCTSPKKKKNAVLAHPFTAKCPPNQQHRQNHMWSACIPCRWRRKMFEDSMEDFCLTCASCIHMRLGQGRQAGCISCSTWMNSAAEHAQVMLSKGQFELSQTGVEPLIGMLSRFHFSRALFWFTTAVLSLFLSLSLSLPHSAVCLTSSAVSSLALGKKSSSVIDKNLVLY